MSNVLPEFSTFLTKPVVAICVLLVFEFGVELVETPVDVMLLVIVGEIILPVAVKFVVVIKLLAVKSLKKDDML